MLICDLQATTSSDKGDISAWHHPVVNRSAVAYLQKGELHYYLLGITCLMLLYFVAFSQEIADGVNKSVRAVQAAEAGIQQLGILAQRQTICMYTDFR